MNLNAQAIPGGPSIGVVEVRSAHCTIWFTKATLDPDAIRLLSDFERDRMQRLRQEADRQRFLAGCIMSRVFLGQKIGEVPARLEIDRTCPRCGEPHGKPHLRASDWQYSLSHSGEYVVAAFCEGSAVGVDIESAALPRSSNLAATVLSDAELAVFYHVPPAERSTAFLRYWTRKEAVLKCRGVGLTVDPRLVEVSPPDASSAVVRLAHELAGAPLTLIDLEMFPGHPASLAIEAAAVTVTIAEYGYSG